MRCQSSPCVSPIRSACLAQRPACRRSWPSPAACRRWIACRVRNAPGRGRVERCSSAVSTLSRPRSRYVLRELQHVRSI